MWVMSTNNRLTHIYNNDDEMWIIAALGTLFCKEFCWYKVLSVKSHEETTILRCLFLYATLYDKNDDFPDKLFWLVTWNKGYESFVTFTAGRPIKNVLFKNENFRKQITNRLHNHLLSPNTCFRGLKRK